MKTSKENIDDIIKKALNEEEARFYDELDEQNLFQMVGGLFSGKLKWFIVMMNVIMVAVFVLLVYCLIQFFNTDDIGTMLRWGAISAISLIAIAMLKLFAWMQMNKNVLMREIKRLELQLSAISQKIG
ncbi:MAG: hypothetical protein HKO90_05310 [Flavobacteriaceae bacterium]|nr:hypothetical protein [Bacteroidia bacterium]NNK87680.1 hypothetical protein [Flavobacteriaceae bacterium]